MFLRVSDRMFEVLYQNIEQLDLKFKKNISENKNLNSFLGFLESIKIKKPGFLDSGISIAMRKSKYSKISILKGFPKYD